MREDGPHPVDVHVGQRLRMRRTLLGMSQEMLAERLGISFQQLQKYEKGSNRLSASRLFELSRILDVPVSFFFEELPAEGAPTEESEPDPLMKRESLELVRAYYDIPDPQIRQRLVDLIRLLG
ncbi:MAG: helix-turn-helix transcriptional regulator [Rhodospirillaceae bacterium]|nr:helix-turn-helix transcriptional regulator [Rhodospirillaceae bacterium]